MGQFVALSNSILAAVCVLLSAASPAFADWDDRPGFDFHPQTSEASPCGVGTPPRGHFAGEISPTSLPQGLTLTVKQDAHRLCYVAGNIAEAPVIRVRQGADFSILLKNEITNPAAIANFVTVGRLDTPNDAVLLQHGAYQVVPGAHHTATGATNLHLHGFAIPPVAPQDEVIRTCADPMTGQTMCGQHEIAYRYHVPKTMPAGLYWYHPHVHGEVQAQMLMGLSGAIVVEGQEDDARRAAGIQDRIFIIRQSQDLDVAAPVSATAAVTVPTAPAPRAAPLSGILYRDKFQETVDTAHELGCSSNTGIDQITLNGSKVLNGDVSDDGIAHIEIGAGTTQLWRILNAATDAFLDLSLVDEEGKPYPITVVARDGAPLDDDLGKTLPEKPTAGSQPVPPSGRVEFLITAPPVGRKIYFITHAVDTGCAGDKVPERKLALVTSLATATATTSVEPPALSVSRVAPDFFSGLLARKTDRQRTIALAEYPRPGTEDQTDFYIAERKPGAAFRPYDMNGPPLITVNAGTTEEWVIENWTNELHAFHVHQVHFRVLGINGRDISDPTLSDVVSVPYATRSGPDLGTVVPGRVRIKLTFPEDLAGDIPFHCHLVDHEDNGMMAVLRVIPIKLGALYGRQPAPAAVSNLWKNPLICSTRQQTSRIADLLPEN